MADLKESLTEEQSCKYVDPFLEGLDDSLRGDQAGLPVRLLIFLRKRALACFEEMLGIALEGVSADVANRVDDIMHRYKALFIDKTGQVVGKFLGDLGRYEASLVAIESARALAVEGFDDDAIEVLANKREFNFQAFEGPLEDLTEDYKNFLKLVETQQAHIAGEEKKMKLARNIFLGIMGVSAVIAIASVATITVATLGFGALAAPGIAAGEVALTVPAAAIATFVAGGVITFLSTCSIAGCGIASHKLNQMGDKLQQVGCALGRLRDATCSQQNSLKSVKDLLSSCDGKNETVRDLLANRHRRAAVLLQLRNDRFGRLLAEAGKSCSSLSTEATQLLDEVIHDRHMEDLQQAKNKVTEKEKGCALY